MERLIYLDTHAVLWLYMGQLNFFPPHVCGLIDEKPFAISPVVTLELQYLHEIGRLKDSGEKTVHVLEKELGLKVAVQDFAKIVKESLKLSWTRDPFDRLIVAQAALTSSTLITRDEKILKHYSHALWR